MNASLSNVDTQDTRVLYSGLSGWHQGQLYQFAARVLLIHIGKTGGGTVRRMLWAANVTNDQVHVHPVPRAAIASHSRIVICVRDPVDRFISAYNHAIIMNDAWAVELAKCYDVNRFALQFAYRRINPSLQSARGACAKLDPVVDAWAATVNYSRYGHSPVDGCFHVGGCIQDLAGRSKDVFVVRTEMMDTDSQSLLEWLNAKHVDTIHNKDNSAATTSTQITTQLKPFAREALEVALVDEYQLVNRVLRLSSNAPFSAYCVKHAEVEGLLHCSSYSTL